MLLAWVCAAFAVLSKGIVVGPLAGGALVAYSVLERDFRPWRRLHLLPGLILFGVICVPWFVLVSARNPSFLEFFFVHEHFARFLTTAHRRTEPWWYFMGLLLIGSLPWLAAAPGALRIAWLDKGLKSTFKPLKFLFLFCAVTLLFFSLSESKLAPYILPLFPPLAAIIGTRMSNSPTFVRTLARVDGVLLPLLAGGLAVYAERRFGFLPGAALPWLLSAGLIALYGVMATWKRDGEAGPAWATAASAILAWQCLLSAFAELPERSSYKLVTTVKPLIRPETHLYTIGQYRETLSPYLGRTMDVVDFEGELQFGLSEEPARRLSQKEFLGRWDRSPDAVAFMAPELFDAWQSRGMQGKVLGGDNQTLVIGRR
jgi:4-amino-4-deoxy-L-arabinose transferase-like glycosyltransferase